MAEFSSLSKEELELLLMSMKKELDNTRSELSMNITRKEGRLERTFNAGHFSFSNNYIPFKATLALENLPHVCLSGFNNYSVMNDSINDSFAMYINAKYI